MLYYLIDAVILGTLIAFSPRWLYVYHIVITVVLPAHVVSRILTTLCVIVMLLVFTNTDGEPKYDY